MLPLGRVTNQYIDASASAPVVHPTPPSTPVIEVVIGLAAQLVLEKFNLGLDVEVEIIDCLEHMHHWEWYWRFRDSCSLVHNVACELAVAMHLDADIVFDYKTCITTPYSPWTIH